MSLSLSLPFFASVWMFSWIFAILVLCSASDSIDVTFLCVSTGGSVLFNTLFIWLVTADIPRGKLVALRNCLYLSGAVSCCLGGLSLNFTPCFHLRNGWRLNPLSDVIVSICCWARVHSKENRYRVLCASVVRIS